MCSFADGVASARPAPGVDREAERALVEGGPCARAVGEAAAGGAGGGARERASGEAASVGVGARLSSRVGGAGGEAAVVGAGGGPRSPRSALSTRSAARGLLPSLSLLLGAGTLVSGCYASHLCGTEERCNLRDDDCDGRVDEGFVSDDGVYRSPEACGHCGVACADVFPTAEATACDDTSGGEPRCVLVSCAPGFHFAGDGACVPDVPVLCLPCTTDDDCAVRLPAARCLPTGTGAPRCGQPCGATAPCPEGFACAEGPEPMSGQCVPESGICGCTSATEDVELACVLESPVAGMRCAGVQRCGATGPGPCEPVLGEGCNAQDDDCDGGVDEDFRDAAGRYVDRFNCGACATPCVEPGPNMIATCLPEGTSARCEVECVEGFVDVDRILANGCECERWTGSGPPPAVGGDADCDGVPDDTNDFVYVTATGSDTNPGTLARPMRTIQAAIGRAAAEGKDVLVARGIYEGPVAIRGGVSVFGGYSPDFRDRDLELFPVLLERRSGAGGLPALTCTGVTAPTELEGFVVVGTDATAPGSGSTAVFLDGCGPAVLLRSIEVLAGRGADGARGDDSSANLADRGFSSLADLDGTSGRDGARGTGDAACTRVAGGAGGGHVCGGVDVGGGAGGAADCPGNICRNGSPCGNAGCTDFTVGGVCDIDAARAIAVGNPLAGAGRGPGAGAAGAQTFNAPTNRGVCNFCDDNPTLPREGEAGGDGATGADGVGGLGCGGAWSMDASGRVRGSDGASGAAGTDGGGGGGGSAGSGYEVIGGTSGECRDRSGGSGGGGGSGGCGAPGADGGTGGGYAIAIVVRITPALGAGPSFEDIRVVTASAGDGGDGGTGADGGRGGVGGIGGASAFWCSRTGGRGGEGGRGGAAGGGGGGCGGGSHGVFLVAPSGGEGYRDVLASTLVIESAGVAGRAGRGGFSPGVGGTDGAAATAAPVVLVRP